MPNAATVPMSQSALQSAAAAIRGARDVAAYGFQAPRFYEKFGFRRLGAIPNYPQGHEYIVYIKDLTRAAHAGPLDSAASPPEELSSDLQTRRAS
jgi:hypothetical protein